MAGEMLAVQELSLSPTSLNECGTSGFKTQQWLPVCSQDHRQQGWDLPPASAVRLAQAAAGLSIKQ